MFFAVAIACLFACSQSEPTTKTDSSPLPGVWQFVYDLGEVQHIQTVELNPQHDFIFFNATESILADSIDRFGDTLRIHLPIYGTYIDLNARTDSTMTGYFVNPGKIDYRIPVRATRGSREHHLPAPPGTDTLTYACTFSPDTDDAYPAEGLFTLNGSNLYATFRTETGDYRFLEGTPRGNHWEFGCFDGSHLFHFTADLKGDSLFGKFYSGNHWSEPFQGKNMAPSPLRDPFEITRVVNDLPLEPRIFNESGDTLHLEQDYFIGKPHIVHILGTWCPNCLDESRYLAELSQRYSDKQLAMTGFAFERKADLELCMAGIERYRKQTGIHYPIYLSGNAVKGEASSVFPMLSGISSFPTTLVIDRSGNIVLVHTGFNGPGTGAYYTQFTKRFEAVLDSLIAAP